MIPYKFQSKSGDFLKSGYDRGHMAPAGDFIYDQLSMDQSFVLANISPQIGVGFNRNYWKYFEIFIRNLCDVFDEIFVFTGPMYLPEKDINSGKYYVKYEVIGSMNDVAVPTHYYKVILATRKDNYYLQGFVLPNLVINDRNSITNFVKPIKFIETATGMTFFENLGESKEEENKSICSEIDCIELFKTKAEIN